MEGSAAGATNFFLVLPPTAPARAQATGRWRFAPQSMVGGGNEDMQSFACMDRKPTRETCWEATEELPSDKVA